MNTDRQTRNYKYQNRGSILKLNSKLERQASD